MNKELSKIKKKKADNSVFKLMEDMNGKSSQKKSNVCYTQENMETGSTSIVIRSM